MVPDPDTAATPSTSLAEQSFDTPISALIGAVAGVVLSFIPFATLLGGMVAGYLRGGESEDGLKAGALAGVIMLVPFTLLLYFLLFLVGVGGAPLWFGLIGLVLLLLSALYTVGLSVLGGYLGVYLKNEM